MLNDLGDFYRVPADNRDLSCGQYSEFGCVRTTESSDYTSENTRRIGVDEIVSMLQKLPYIMEMVSNFKNGKVVRY